MRVQHLAGLCAVIGVIGAASSDVPSDDPFPRGDFFRRCPLEKCGEGPPVEQLRAPGIGFALETGHGTAVVRLHDGTYHKVALIEGNEEYTALLRRWGTDPVPRAPDHLDTAWEKAQYAKDRAQRRLNKLLGLPATKETAILAEMVAALRDTTQTWLGEEFTVFNVVVSSPDRVNLTDEENGDVLNYLKMRKLNYGRLYSSAAAYMGTGRGLCTNYLDTDACDREEWYLPLERVLHIDFNDESLSAGINSLTTAAHIAWADLAFIDPGLGYRHRPTAESEEQVFWEAVTARIREVVLSMPHYLFVPRVSQLLLTGTHVDDAAFQRAVRDAVEDLIEKDALAILDAKHIDSSGVGNARHVNNTAVHGPLAFLTAQGAAEIAKRFLEGPVGCAQTDECRARREREHARKDSPALIDQSVVLNLDL